MVDISVAATLTAAIIGAFFGTIGTYVLQRLREERVERQQAQQLRRGLLGDLNAMGFFDDWPADYGPDRAPAHEIASAEYFKAIAPNLGKLSEKENERIADFYSGLINVNEMVRWNYDLTHTILSDPKLVNNEKNRIQRNKKLCRAIQSLAEHHTEMRQLLQSNLEDEPPTRTERLKEIFSRSE